MFAALKSIARLAGPPLDPDAVSPVDLDLARAVAPILELVSRYFRAEVSGLEKIPKGGALLAANHNAGITSIEPMLLGLRWYRHTGGQDLIRSLGHDVMGKIPLLGNFLIALGMVRASHAAADRALNAGQKVLVLPGGNYEAFRPYGQRHQVDFGGHVGYVRLALRNNVPVLPVLNLGGHETLFVVSRGAALARLTGVKKLLRSDSFPLFFALPWGVALGPLFHLPIPAKLVVEVGEPIDLREELQGEDPDDPQTLRRLSELVQGRVQQMMDRQAAKRRFPVIG